MLGLRYCKDDPECELMKYDQVYIKTMYVCFTELTKIKKSKDMVLGVQLVIQAFPAVKTNKYSKTSAIQEEICRKLKGYDWFNQKDFFGQRSVILIDSLMQLKITTLLAEKRWKRINAVEMFSYQERANAFAQVNKRFTDAFVLRVAYNEKDREIQLFAPDNFQQLYPLRHPEAMKKLDKIASKHARNQVDEVSSDAAPVFKKSKAL